MSIYYANVQHVLAAYMFHVELMSPREMAENARKAYKEVTFSLFCYSRKDVARNRARI